MHINPIRNNFFLFWKFRTNLHKNDCLFLDFLALQYYRNRSGISILLELVSFGNIINWFSSFTQILSHWDRKNTIGFRIVCRFRIWNLYSFTSSLSKSDNHTATLLCSATLEKRGVLRHISVLIQLINYIHLGYMPELSSFL